MIRLTPLLVLGLSACLGPQAGPQQEHLGPVTGLTLVDGLLVSCSQAGLQLGNNPLLPLPCRPVALAVIPGSTELLVAGGQPGEAGILMRVHRSGRILAQRKVSADLLYTLAVHPQASVAAAGGSGGHLILFDPHTLETRTQLPRHRGDVRCMAFSPDGNWLCSGSRDGLLRAHPLSGGDTREMGEHLAGVESLCLIREGSQLFMYSGSIDGKIRRHALDSGRQVQIFPPLPGAVVGLRRAQDGSLRALTGTGELFRLSGRTVDRVGRVPDPVFCLAPSAQTGQWACGGTGGHCVIVEPASPGQ